MVIAPAPGHGVPGIDHQVHDHLLDLAGVGHDLAQIRLGDGDQFDVFTEEAPQHLIQVQDQIIEVEHLGGEDLLAAEGQELAGQGGGPLRRLVDFLQIIRGADRPASNFPCKSSL